MEEKIERRSALSPFLFGMATGAVVGGILGILFTPRAGRDTRRALGDLTHKVRERVARHPAGVHSGSYDED